MKLRSRNGWPRPPSALGLHWPEKFPGQILTVSFYNKSISEVLITFWEQMLSKLKFIIKTEDYTCYW